MVSGKANKNVPSVDYNPILYQIAKPSPVLSPYSILNWYTGYSFKEKFYFILAKQTFHSL